MEKIIESLIKSFEEKYKRKVTEKDMETIMKWASVLSKSSKDRLKKTK